MDCDENFSIYLRSQPGTVLTETRITLKPLSQTQAQSELANIVHAEIKRAASCKDVCKVKNRIKQIGELTGLDIQNYENTLTAATKLYENQRN